MDHVTQPLISADISIFSPENNFAISRNTDTDCTFMHNFQFFQLFFEHLKIVLINMVTILIISAKMAALGFLKIRIFWNKCYDIIISVHDVINKILPCDSNYVVDLVL